MVTKTYLIVGPDNKAINSIVIDVPDGGQLIEYEGAFWPDAVWDGTQLIEPPPPPADPPQT